MRTLTNDEFLMVRGELESHISKNIGSPHSNDTQRLEGIWEIILLQAMIPLLVSLTSSVLTEILKNRGLSSFKRKEAEEIIEDLTQKPLQPRDELTQECLIEVQHILGPLGLEQDDIKQIYVKVKYSIMDKQQ